LPVAIRRSDAARFVARMVRGARGGVEARPLSLALGLEARLLLLAKGEDRLPDPLLLRAGRREEIALHPLRDPDPLVPEPPLEELLELIELDPRLEADPERAGALLTIAE
jgi:hypothetical protein